MQDLDIIVPTDYVYEDLVFPVQDFKDGLCKTIMDAIIKTQFEALDTYSKVLLVRFDLRTFEPSYNNEQITNFRKRFVAHLSKKYSSDIWFFWVREQVSKTSNTHYHIFVALSHHEALNNWSIKDSAELAEFFNPNVSYWDPYPSHYIIYRGDAESLTYATHRTSYLAKNHTKEFTPAGVKRYQASFYKHHSPTAKRRATRARNSE